MPSDHDLIARVRGTAHTFKKRIAVLPAYNAASTLEATLADSPSGAIDEIILVDDGSRDGTVELARRLGLTVIVHDKTRGYGGNQKTCYDEALRRGADWVVMVHPDYQYDARLIPFFCGIMESGVCDVMMGSRVRSRREALDSGMPLSIRAFVATPAKCWRQFPTTQIRMISCSTANSWRKPRISISALAMRRCHAAILMRRRRLTLVEAHAMAC